MSRHGSNVITAALPSYFEEAADSGTYTTDAGVASIISCTLQPTGFDYMQTPDSEKKVQLAELRVLNSDIASPGLNDTWDDGTTVWVVIGTLSNSNGMAVLEMREIEITQNIAAERMLEPA